MNIHSAERSRRSLRLSGYDYGQPGAYFVTVCTQGRECLFGDVVDGEMVLSTLGKIVDEEWARTPKIRREIELDAFQVMPNHIHGIVVITGESNSSRNRGLGADVGAHGRAPLQGNRGSGLWRPPKSLGSFIAGFKSAVTKRINIVRGEPGRSVWQRNYFEHVIRNESELDVIRSYIVNNPVNWNKDSLNPNCHHPQAKPKEQQHGSARTD